jgi:hypothetical protein
MPSIVIKEIDATTAGNAAVETDVVFIPGFMNTSFSDKDYWDDAKTRTPAKAKVPTLCTSVAQFERCFGKKPAKLVDVNNEFKYSDITTSGYTTTGKEETEKKDGKISGTTLTIAKSITKSVFAHPSLTESNHTVTLGAGVKTIELPVQVTKGSYTVDTDLDSEGGSDTAVATYDVKVVHGGNTVYANVGKDGSTIKLATAPEAECTVYYYEASSAVKLTFINEVKENNEVISSSRNTIYVNGISGEGTYTVDLTGVELPETYTNYEVSYFTGTTVVAGTKIFEGALGADNLAFNDDGEGNYFDPSYIYAKELLALGLPVLYCSYNTEGDGINPSAGILYGWLLNDSDEGAFNLVADRGMYDVKYITTGGYPNFESEPAIYTKMKSLAVQRGDCVALIDHLNAPDAVLLGESSFYGRIVKAFEGDPDGDKCAAFTPWVNIKGTAVTGTHTLPPSFAYLSALAVSIRTNANWLAVAGATRGAIPNLDGDAPLNIDKVLTNSIAEEGYQHRKGVSINAITNIQPYGYRIWGNRTLKTNPENLVATSFLNIRNLVSEIKKVTYRACRKYMFEQNNDILWTNFKAAIEPTLEQMRTGAGISGYKIIKETTNEKAKLVATIKLYPIYAVEDFEITVRMEDDEIALS